MEFIQNDAMMTRCNILYVIVCLMMPLWAVGQEGKTPKQGPKSYEEFFKEGMKRLDAVFPVYELDDKYYMEIPNEHIGRDVYIAGQMLKGIGVRGSGLESAGVVHFERGPKDKLYMYSDYDACRVSDERQPELANILHDETLMPIEAVYPIVAWGKDSVGVIFEITSLIKGNGSWYRLSDEGTSAALNKNAQSGGGEMILVDGMSKQANGVKFMLTWIVDQNVAGIECHIDLLPERKMRMRYADKRIGYETLNYYDFGCNPYGIKKKTIITKWNLEPKDMNRYAKGILTEPKEPIVFYLDNCFPKELVKYAEAGVLEWQKAFEQAGFKNAIQVKVARNEDELTSAKAVITYSVNAGSNSASFERDIRTGEIIAGRININHVTLGGYLDTYFVRCGVLDSRVAKDMYDPHVAGMIIRMFVTQNVGYVLGLLPNNAGSYAYTPAQLRDRGFVRRNGFSASVLDDASYNFLAQPEDKMTTDELICWRLGVYDRWAIEWGYRVFPGSENADTDKALLKKLADKRLADAKLFFSERKGYDPRALTSDLSSDKLEAARLGLRNTRLFIENLDKLSMSQDKLDDGWNMYLEGGRSALGTMYQNLVYKVMENIGGCMEEKDGMEFPSKELQRESLDFLGETAMAAPAAWEYDPILTREFGVGSRETHFGLQEILFSYLMSPKVVENLELFAQLKGEQAYSPVEFWKDMKRIVFKNFDANVRLSDYECHVENIFINCFMDLMVKNMVLNGSNRLSTYGSNMIYWINDVLEHVGMLAEQHKDQDMRDHYRVLKQRILMDMALVTTTAK